MLSISFITIYNDSSLWDVPVQLVVSMYHHHLTAVRTIIRHTVGTGDWRGSFNVINGPLQRPITSYVVNTQASNLVNFTPVDKQDV